MLNSGWMESKAGGKCQKGRGKAQGIPLWFTQTHLEVCSTNDWGGFQSQSFLNYPNLHIPPLFYLLPKYISLNHTESPNEENTNFIILLHVIQLSRVQLGMQQTFPKKSQKFHQFWKVKSKFLLRLKLYNSKVQTYRINFPILKGRNGMKDKNQTKTRLKPSRQIQTPVVLYFAPGA